MTKHKMVQPNLDDWMTDLDCDQQRSIHGGTYFFNDKGGVTIDDGNDLELYLPGYDLVSLGKDLLAAGVHVPGYYQIVKN